MSNSNVIIKPHISISQVNQHLRCPEQWRCRKELGPRPPGFALLKGSAIHKGAAVNYIQKIDTHEDLPSTDVVDASVEALKYRIDMDGYSLTPDEQTVGAKKVIGEVTDRTAILAKLFSDDVAPKRQPIEVEQRQRIVLPDCTHDLVGVVDLVTDDGQIPDLKTAGKKKNQADADTSLQLTWYALAYQLKYKKPPSKVGFDILVDKKVPEAQFLSTLPPTQEGYDNLIRIVDAVLQSIKTGVFLPCQQEPRSWMCLDMKTEVITERGWMSYSQLNKTEPDYPRIMTIDKCTWLLEWQHPEQVFAKPHGGKMVQYKGRGIRFSVTPDHRMLVRSTARAVWRTVLASEVEGKSSLAFPVAAQMYRSGVNLTDNEISLSGWLCAEGHFRKDSPLIEFSQSPNSRYWQDIIDLFDRMGIEYAINKSKSNPNSSSFRIRVPHSRRIREYQPDKSIQPWLRQATGRQFRVWLKSFVDGDGSRRGARSAVVSQKEEEFIDELQMLCLSNRMSANKSTEKVSSSGGRYWTLSILDGVTERFTESAVARKNYVGGAVADTVWCVSVPNQYIVTRYEGKPLITGNCSPKFCGYFGDGCRYHPN